jgi:predicted unusual protein kinase regulating ubiquinone biosynthesis (AarF/ABC1/UbiB family)
MEFIEGTSLNVVTRLVSEGREHELEELLPGIDVREVMHRLAQACFKQLFVVGFFHGDPHPGNIIVCPDGSVAFVDFGIFGELTPWHRERMASMIENVSLGNVHEAFWCYADLADPTTNTDMQAFERAGQAVFGQWYKSSTDEGTDVADRHLGKYAGQMTELVRRYRLRLGWETLLFWRALHALDSTALLVPEHFDLIVELRTFFTTERGSAVRRIRDVIEDPYRIGTALQLSRSMPQHRFTLERALSGRVAWQVVDQESREQERLETRTAQAIAVAAVAASVALLAAAPRSSDVITAVLFVGFAVLWVVTERLAQR